MTYEKQIETLSRSLCKEYFWGLLAGKDQFSASAQEQFDYQDANWINFRWQATHLLNEIIE